MWSSSVPDIFLADALPGKLEKTFWIIWANPNQKLHVVGNIFATGTITTAFSDIRLKTITSKTYPTLKKNLAELIADRNDGSEKEITEFLTNFDSVATYEKQMKQVIVQKDKNNIMCMMLVFKIT